MILDSYGYFMLEIFFILCLEIALLAAAFLYIYNSIKKGMLNDPATVRRAKLAAIEAEAKAKSGDQTATSSSPDSDQGYQAVDT